MTKAIAFLIKVIGCMVGVAMWCTVGLAIWAVKLIRVSVAYSIKTMLQAFKEQDMTPIEHSIKMATNFWPQGFARILKIFDSNAADSVEIEVTWGKIVPGLLQDIFYAMFLVGSTYLVYIATSTNRSDIVFAIQHQAKKLSFYEPSQINALRPPSPKGIGVTESQQQAPQPIAASQSPRPASSAQDQSGAQNELPPKWISTLRAKGVKLGTGLGYVGGVTVGQSIDLIQAQLGVPSSNIPKFADNGIHVGRQLVYVDSQLSLKIDIAKDGKASQLTLVDRSFGRAFTPAISGPRFGVSSEQIARSLGVQGYTHTARSPDCFAAVQDARAFEIVYPGVHYVVCKKTDSLIAAVITL